MKYISLKLFFLIFANSLHVQYAKLKSESIVGGNDAEVGQLRYMVSLQANEHHMCGAGIIGSQHVLSAAHCFIGEDWNFLGFEYSILAGTIDVSYIPDSDRPGLRISVEKVYVPKEFARRSPNPQMIFYRSIGDIAVVKLTEKFNPQRGRIFKKLHFPVISNSIPLYANEKAIFAGYGLGGIAFVVPPNSNIPVEVPTVSTCKLKFAETKVFSNEDCAARIHEYPISESHLCAQVKQRDPNFPEGKCSGDSGSPLVFEDSIVIGISSTSNYGCDERIVPGVYTRVTSYLSFIRRALRDVTSSDMRDHIYNN